MQHFYSQSAGSLESDVMHENLSIPKNISVYSYPAYPN